MQFKTGGADIPGKPGASGLKAGKGSDGEYDIAFVPKMRMYRIVFSPASRERKQQTRFVPESWASWEPLEQ